MLRAPIAGLLLLCELTGGLQLLVPLMIANACGYAVAHRCERLGLYDALLARDAVGSA